MSRTSPFCFCLAFAYCESHFLSCTLSCHGRGFARAAFGSLVAGVVVSSQRRFARPALLAAHGYWTLALVLRRSFIRGIGGASPFASCGCLTRISARGREGRLRPRWSQALRLIGLVRGSPPPICTPTLLHWCPRRETDKCGASEREGSAPSHPDDGRGGGLDT